MSHHVPKGQKDLDNALRAIKAKSGTLAASPSLSASSKGFSSAATTSAAVIPTVKQVKPKATSNSVFGAIEDDDDDDDQSGNVVRHVPQGLAGAMKRDISSRTNGGRGYVPTSSVIEEQTMNKLVKTGYSYYGDKMDRQQRNEEEMSNKLSMDLVISKARQELAKIRRLVIEERDNLAQQVCFPCKRKFTSLDIKERHEETDIHKKICAEAQSQPQPQSRLK